MILDSDVLIDLKRGQDVAALNWFAALPEYPSISIFAAMELLFGSRDSQELRDVEVFLAPFPIVCPAIADVHRAMSYAKLKLQGGLGILDALTASVAVGNDEPVATFNTKHFRLVPGLRLIEPYNRSPR